MSILEAIEPCNLYWAEIWLGLSLHFYYADLIIYLSRKENSQFHYSIYPSHSTFSFITKKYVFNIPFGNVELAYTVTYTNVKLTLS